MKDGAIVGWWQEPRLPQRVSCGSYMAIHGVPAVFQRSCRGKASNQHLSPATHTGGDNSVVSLLLNVEIVSFQFSLCSETPKIQRPKEGRLTTSTPPFETGTNGIGTPVI